MTGRPRATSAASLVTCVHRAGSQCHHPGFLFTLIFSYMKENPGVLCLKSILDPSCNMMENEQILKLPRLPLL